MRLLLLRWRYLRSSNTCGAIPLMTSRDVGLKLAIAAARVAWSWISAIVECGRVWCGVMVVVSGKRVGEVQLNKEFSCLRRCFQPLINSPHHAWCHRATFPDISPVSYLRKAVCYRRQRWTAVNWRETFSRGRLSTLPPCNM